MTHPRFCTEGFTKKGYARIYVEKTEDISKVHNLIREIDEYEWDYFPEGLVTTFDEYPQLVYTHKFDAIDPDYIVALCWKRGIKCFAVDAGREDGLRYVVKDPEV